MFSSKSDEVTGTPSKKGEQTRELIRSTAVRSFRERGYEETTVRLVAAEAGVSVGVLNYHFASKNDLVQELYVEVMREFRADALERMSGVSSLPGRVGVALEAGLDALSPFHGFAPGFLAASMSPRSAINPLSSESVPALNTARSVFKDAVGGSEHKLPSDIVEALPDALTMAFLLLSLFWSYDSSPSQAKTQRLLERSLRLFKTALPFSRVPAFRRPVRELLELISEVRP